MFEEERDPHTYRLFISQIPDTSEEYDRFISKLDRAYDFSWENSSHAAKTDEKNLKSQIEPSEVVVVLSGLYSPGPEIIKNIFSIASQLKKPVVLIRPYGVENVPLELEEKASDVIGWNAPCIVDAIKGVLNNQNEESCKI